MKDVQLTAANDDQYFIFEDMIYQAMLCFSRDTEVRPCTVKKGYRFSRSQPGCH
jgi:hypothetical protein